VPERLSPLGTGCRREGFTTIPRAATTAARRFPLIKDEQGCHDAEERLAMAADGEFPVHAHTAILYFAYLDCKDYGSLHSKKLWSLWDMLQFRAAGFVQLVNFISTIQMGMHIHEQQKSNVENPFKGFTSDAFHADANRLAAHLDEIGLNLSKISLLRLLEQLRCEPFDGKAALRQAEAFIGRVVDELQSSFLLSLSANEASLFEPKEPIFGNDVDIKFPSASYEIEQGTKCYALGFSTATVFHMMRVMEIAIRATARCLGIPDPLKPAERNWGNVLRKIKDGYETKWSTASRMTGDGRFFEELYAFLEAVRNPWRNATMHIEKKYTPEEAKHIMDAVGSFMKKLASRLDEAGQPVA